VYEETGPKKETTGMEVSSLLLLSLLWEAMVETQQRRATVADEIVRKSRLEI
jgi:hypothetical protein